MKLFFKKLIANARPILQILGLIIAFLLPGLLNVSKEVVEQPELTASQNLKDYIFYFVWNKGDIAIGIFLFVVTLFIMRKWNKNDIFNKGDEYKNYPYSWYWICAKVLGYTECNLILVPIYLQFKLVIRDTFPKYYCGELEKKDSDVISVERLNFSRVSDELNMIIADTYPLQVSQIPRNKRLKPIIIISRDNVVDHNRYNSPELVGKVVNEVRNLPSSIRKVNIYATTNPHNTMKIAQNAFKLGERSSLDLITVFQQKRTDSERKFEQAGKIIYKR